MVVLLCGGLLTGLFGGALGIGGGVVLVPALSLWFGYSLAQACSISLFSIVASSLCVSFRELRRGRVALRWTSYMEATGCAFGFVGYLLATLFQGQEVLIFIALLLAWMCGQMIWVTWRKWLATSAAVACVSGAGAAGGQEQAFGARRPPALALGIFSLTGLVSGACGVGGGLFLVPALTHLFGFSFRVAAATSSYAMGGIAGGALTGYVLAQEVPWIDCAVAAQGVVVGSWLGMRLKDVASEKWLEISLTLAFVVVTFSLWRDLLASVLSL